MAGQNGEGRVMWSLQTVEMDAALISGGCRLVMPYQALEVAQLLVERIVFYATMSCASITSGGIDDLNLRGIEPNHRRKPTNACYQIVHLHLADLLHTFFLPLFNLPHPP